MTTPLISVLRPRDPAEGHRSATPLELFTDLCFVVAVAQAATALHHAGSEGHLIEGVGHFGLVFFAIWWTWLNFAWFASAYDDDGAAYRVLTLLQIFGSLVLAAGIPRMFEGEFVLGVAGYVIMRLGLVAQWMRAAAGDPERATTCRHYAAGISAVQVLWIAYLFVPHSLDVPLFLVLVACELAVPVWAERSGQTPWHPHHIAERYGLFYIIVLGETILSTTVAIQQALDEREVDAALVGVVAGGVLIVFSAWWLYFARDSAAFLSRVRYLGTGVEYLWGFGHYFIFAAAAALGAGLAVRVDHWTHHAHASEVQTAAALTIPLAVLLAALWAVTVRPHAPSGAEAARYAVAIVVVLASTYAAVP
ncbi:low temperature requirement protein LtrA [Mumia flava]|uniref:Low temperature requirement protein LtrA n=1 Tax=Mumia flava TaxID=1348852 RepID=A0A2M9BHD5_9ACTN|nr:low temperature requirement protein A [Mumia flava]PJJ57353.1 low temperature requirement protein LtrA [Mumia flava]